MMVRTRASRWVRAGCAVALALFVTGCSVRRSVRHVPDLAGMDTYVSPVEHLSDTARICGTSSLAKNRYGLWELHLKGDPLELGQLNGVLTRDLFHYQEKVFFEQVEQIVPSKTGQWFLRKFLKWFNRKMYLHVPNEFQAEILGLARFAGDDFDHLAPDALRILYLHGAHDVGHAVEGLSLVGCSSFAAWDEASEDGELILGRNFDFYAGDDFARNKVVALVEPDRGHRFLSVAWPGMIGVVSGMNEHGLTVTMNAGKSGVPLTAKTPISLLAREILQYARNIEEAIVITEERDVFVSESLMIGSAEDGKAVLIELAPQKRGVHRVEGERLICANHFQCNAFTDDKKNQQQIAESHSQHRYHRMQELIAESGKLDVDEVATILRDREGVKRAELGMGNELALNQLQAHHGIIFKPESRQVWVSAPPYQLGEFVAYDLDEMFGNKWDTASSAIDSLCLPEDPFLHDPAFDRYMQFRQLRTEMQRAISNEEPVNDPQRIIELNPNLWEAHYLCGAYHHFRKEHDLAIAPLQRALELPIPWQDDREAIQKMLEKSQRKAR